MRTLLWCQTIGQSIEHVVFQNAHHLGQALGTAGSLDDWKNSIARLAQGNSRLIFAISTAFAACLVNILGEDSGGFHFRGASSSGKSTALKVAASVCCISMGESRKLHSPMA